MPHYRVQIDAKNLLVEMNGRLAKHGFFVFRFVTAKDRAEAGPLAKQMLLDDPELAALVKNVPGDPPAMDVVEVVEAGVFPNTTEQPGRVWYEMKPKRWWQFWRPA
ncbi:MAG TPA: hypothetical protein VGE52_18585 [Pirellulales bacterium]